MKTAEVEVFSEATNDPVVRMQGRAFPGIVIQGDSLKNIYALAEEIRALAAQTEQAELTEVASEL
ncbi:MAG: hypothetical protein IAF08_07330 [Rhizobacter sp.]|nr:hypothetical protein [Chlorobiales bacterium]